MTADELRALLVPHLRHRARLEAIERPAVPPLVELLPATADPAEPALIAALDEPDSIAVYADFLEQHGLAERAHWIRSYPDGAFVAATRFGGLPAGRRDEAWPACTCGNPLRFVGQISGADAPEPWYQLLAFYYCWYCYRRDEQYCGGNPRAYEGWLVRGYAGLAPEELVELAAPEETHVLRETFVRAVREPSLPHALALASEVRADEVPLLEQLACELCATPPPRNTGIAIGGHPYLVPADTPRCALCHAPMELALQLAPDPALDASWGDDEAMLVFACREHRTHCGLRTISS